MDTTTAHDTKQRGVMWAVVTTTVWAALLVAAGTALSPWVDLAWPGVPIVQSLAPAVATVGVVVTGLLFWWWRRRLLLVACGLCVLTMCLPLVYSVQDAHKSTACEDRCLTVVTFNARFGLADTAKFAADITSVDADVVLVQEATPDFAARLAAEKVGGESFDRRYPHMVGEAKSGPAGTVTYSRFPLSAPKPWLVDAGFGAPHVSPAAVVSTPDGDVTVANIHTAPPLPGITKKWRNDMDQIRGHIDQTSGPLIVAGDFNADITHPGFRKLRAGFTDGVSSSTAAAALYTHNTWPAQLRTPFTRLDHVLIRGLTPAAGGVITHAGSDHYGVWARVSLL